MTKTPTYTIFLIPNVLLKLPSSPPSPVVDSGLLCLSLTHPLQGYWSLKPCSAASFSVPQNWSVLLFPIPDTLDASIPVV